MPPYSATILLNLLVIWKFENILTHPTRRAIFEKLGRGPLSVVHIGKGLPVSRPAVSQHLKVLREAKLISMQQEGTRSMYRIEQEGISAMRDFLDRFWDEAPHRQHAS